MTKPSGKTVLVVDDDEHMRTISGRLMESLGHRVLTAENGRLALDLLRAGPRPHLIVLDVRMPELDGFETLVGIRNELGLVELPVVMLTAQSSDEDVLKGYGVGADFYLTKPFSSDRLVDVVQYLIGDLSAEERAEIERGL
jgi:two-component system chemotaxis sensor kinase CheA